MTACLHLLPDTGRTAHDPTRCCGGGVAPIFGCAIHGETTGAAKLTGFKSCIGCQDRTTPAEPTTDYKYLVPGVLDPLPTPIHDSTEWCWLTQIPVRDEHVEALTKLALMDLPTPKAEGRGMVYVGGDGPGDRSNEYGLQVAVGIRMARRNGFTGPIEWWYDSERERVHQYLTPDMGEVLVKDFRKLDPAPRYFRGWPNKLTAIANSQFREILFLDADAYVICNPDPLFALLEHHSFCYWGKDDQWAFGDRIAPGVDIGGRHGVQGGQLIIDRVQAWRLIVIAHWINQHSDYYFAEKKHKQVRWHQFGDEDAWAVGIGLLKHHGLPANSLQLGMITPTPRTLEMKLDDRVMIVHRPNDKMHSFGWTPGFHGIAAETDARDELEEVIRGRERNAVGAPQGWRYRKLTNDLEIFRDVATRNEYRLPDRFEPGSVVLDVGANIGSFAWLANQRGAGEIYCVEPHPDNGIILRWNCEAYAKCFEIALWSHADQFLTLEPIQVHPDGTTNTGTAKLGTRGIPVRVEAFDDFVAREVGERPIRFLKLDCEGAEIPILLTTQRLAQIEEIACEIHAPGVWDSVVGKITARLVESGFVVESTCHWIEAGQGHLFAKRKR